MTKRTAEQTLRDELKRAEVEAEKAYSTYQRARDHVAEAEKALAAAGTLVDSAREKAKRVFYALEALLPPAVETDPVVFAEVTGAIDPALSDALDSGVEYERDREERIAAATGMDVETVRKASKS